MSLVYAAFPVLWSLIFWAAVCRDGRVPLMADFQARMAPWSAHAAAEAPSRQWDSLLWDGVAQFYPWRLFLHESARQGELPLWNPDQLCGYPFVGNGQSAIFYPPNWLYFVVHPTHGMALSAFLHSALAGLFTFGLCRCLGLRPEACALAGVAFALGGFMVSWVELPTLTNSATWLPLALWGIELIRLGRNPSGVAVLTTALGMTLLAGHMQIAAYVWLAAMGYAALRLWTFKGKIPDTVRNSIAEIRAMRPGRAVVIANEPHVARLIEVNLTRAGWRVTKCTRAEAPEHLRLRLPETAFFFLGRADEADAEALELIRDVTRESGVRLVVEPIPPLGLSFRGNLYGFRSAVFAAFALGLCLGAAQLLPTVELGGLSPRGSGAPSEAGYQFHVERSLRPVELATLLFPNLLGTPAQGTYHGISYSEHCGFIGALALILALAAIAIRRDSATIAFAVMAGVCLLIALGTPLARVMYFGIPKIGLTGGFTRLLSVYTLCAAVLAGLGLDRLLRAIEGPGPKRLALMALASWLPWLAAAEVFAWGVGFLPAAKADRVYAQTELTRKLQSLPPGRVLPITRREDWRLQSTPTALLPPNAETVYGLRSVQGYDSLYPQTWREYAARAERGDPSPPTNGNMMLVEKWASPEWNLANLRYIASTDALNTDSLRSLGEFDGVHVYENTLALPRAWASPDPAAVLEGRAAPAPITVTDRSPSAVHLEVPDAGPTTVVLADVYYPGWRAFGPGGGAIPIQPFEKTFRSVAIDRAGAIDMAYVPSTVTVGLFLTLCALAAVAAMLTCALGKRCSE